MVNTITKLSKLLKLTVKSVGIALVILVFVVLGIKLLAYSHAQTPSSKVVTSSGKVVSPASVVSDGTAIGGTAVLFNTTNTSPPTFAIHISNGQLVNGSGSPLRLLGVDATGTENACIQNKGLSWNISSTQAEDNVTAAALLSWHINVVRVQLNEDCWLAINGAPAAYSGANYQTAIKNFVTTLNNAGIYAILDLHWAAPSTYQANQQYLSLIHISEPTIQT